MAQRIHVEGNPDRVRRPDRGAKQDEQGHRARGGVDGAAPQADGLVRPHLVGTPIYKMTGSGNDFVMVDGRHAAPGRSEEHTSELQSPCNLVCRLLLEKKKQTRRKPVSTVLINPSVARELWSA